MKRLLDAAYFLNPFHQDNEIPLHTILAWIVVLILLASSAWATPSHLVYTIPHLSQPYWMQLDEETGQMVKVTACEPSPGLPGSARQDTLNSLTKAVLWWAPVTGGGFAPADSHSVAGRGGGQDSFPIPGPGNFYVEVWNIAGRSCASNRATVMPDIVTGVEPEAPDAVLHRRWYDVSGRRVDRLTAQGVYFVKTTWRSGRVKSVKVIVRRGG